ncbi:histidine--tRNA ligase [Kurthia zopfii]|uniref:Histidine--tRNA ligase n=1 Tax=Kurthia zopfii TaxID=1650 RepID=A0A2U3AHL6_9BACL|nr:histidine--tRNA ligase [Kurthia zopfii]PWI24010.1 histidine--tRNA ligase [Kurthia zopfii]TDR44263.1 histidyl-tRNA synthetase [Kurthia zopfii]STX10131.1 Histidine--tRNA ligase [Kurthia zopfii]VEI07894.1 Histidine--tRNA ligase [Kurthia zopfii]GEK29782.1 histidine--tRNA ligase [Kurthia zopfii]
MSFKVPRGTQDILPGESEKWQKIEGIMRHLCHVYRYPELRTPMFESTELFQRGVGDSTDIVQKEMYTFEDRGGRSLTLRPEGTASISRSYVEHKMYGYADQPVKVSYLGPMFRYERSQKGRYRQFVQFGVEAIGSKDPAVDAEVIELAMRVYQEAGLKHLKLVINSLGDKEVRDAHRDALIAHFEPHIGEFCADCQKRLQQNPLRILDCKVDAANPLIEQAPQLTNYLNEESAAYFDQVKKYLDALGIDYVVDPNLVRGLDYYNHTAFEIMSTAEGFGAITTLCGGGRYNGLVEEIGGPESPGIGFGMSIERLLLALEAEEVALNIENDLDLFIVAMDEDAKLKAVELTSSFRVKGIATEIDYAGRKMKAQMKAADRLNAKYVIVLGGSELEEQAANVKNMETGDQEKVPFHDLVNYLLAHK